MPVEIGAQITALTPCSKLFICVSCIVDIQLRPPTARTRLVGKAFRVVSLRKRLELAKAELVFVRPFYEDVRMLIRHRDENAGSFLGIVLFRNWRPHGTSKLQSITSLEADN